MVSLDLPTLLATAGALGLRIDFDVEQAKLSVKGPKAAAPLARLILERKSEVLAYLASVKESAQSGSPDPPPISVYERLDREFRLTDASEPFDDCVATFRPNGGGDPLVGEPLPLPRHPARPLWGLVAPGNHVVAIDPAAKTPPGLFFWVMEGGSQWHPLALSERGDSNS